MTEIDITCLVLIKRKLEWLYSYQSIPNAQRANPSVGYYNLNAYTPNNRVSKCTRQTHITARRNRQTHNYSQISITLP